MRSVPNFGIDGRHRDCQTSSSFPFSIAWSFESPVRVANAIMKDDRGETSFQTTHWSVVLRVAGAEGKAPEGREALDQLCRIYWRPLYSFLRRSGRTPADAEDLTQQFLMELLERDGFSGVHPSKGKFRSFLIASLQNFLGHERRRTNAQKRGSGILPISLNDPELENSYRLEQHEGRTPQEEYEFRWALTVLDRVQMHAREEYASLGKEAHFTQLKEFLPGGEPEKTQEEIGALLGLTVSAVKSEVYRLRQRFGERLREEIAKTVSSPEEVDAEIEFLIRAVGRTGSLRGE
jgi:RNA polymerase sigma factor (sigma-70 family)